LSANKRKSKAENEVSAVANTAANKVDTSYLESLLGYNCRRAALSIIDRFFDRMAAFGLRPVDFSVLSVTMHNPGVTSRQICGAIGILSPNLVRIIQSLDERGLISRKTDENDKRAIGLYLTAAGKKLMREAEKSASELEDEASAALSTHERAQLISMLQRVYRR
jgi:DNA-binding MarR family transcriptional regulator